MRTLKNHANCEAERRHCACSQPAAGGGGHTTRDLGQFSKTGTGLQQDSGMGADGATRPFTEEVVSYKHGDNVILHQWAGGGDLLVNCQSPTPQSFICQARCACCAAQVAACVCAVCFKHSQ